MFQYSPYSIWCNHRTLSIAHVLLNVPLLLLIVWTLPFVNNPFWRVLDGSRLDGDGWEIGAGCLVSGVRSVPAGDSFIYSVIPSFIYLYNNSSLVESCLVTSSHYRYHSSIGACYRQTYSL